MWFYLTFAVLAGGCATFVIHTLLKTSASDTGSSPSDAPQEQTKDVAFYQRQLTDIDRDVANGTLTKEEAARTRIEISRRVLDADKRAQNKTPSSAAPKAVTIGAAVAVALLLFGGGGYLYASLGDNGRADLPLAERYLIGEEAYNARISQEEAEQAAPDRTVQIGEEDRNLIEQLRTALEDRPDDATGHRLLAKQEANLGNYTAARLAQSRVVEIAGPQDVATEDLILLGRIMAYGTAGYVSPQAEAIWGEVLARDIDTPEARFYMGLLYAQTERPDIAYRFWEPLPETGNPNALWMSTLREQFATIAYLAGEKYTPPESQTPPQTTALAGPNAEQVEAAQDMSPEERQQMIVDMVTNLGEKLGTGEGTAQEWARYIRANSVLGNDDIAKQAFDTATIKFENDEIAAKYIWQSGIEAGFIERVQE